MGILGHVAVDVYLVVADILSWFDVVSADTQPALGMRCCWREEAHQSASALAVFSCRRLDDPAVDIADACAHALHEGLSLHRTAEPVYLRVIGVQMRVQTVPLDQPDQINGVVFYITFIRCPMPLKYIGQTN